MDNFIPPLLSNFRPPVTRSRRLRLPSNSTSRSTSLPSVISPLTIDPKKDALFTPFLRNISIIFSRTGSIWSLMAILSENNGGSRHFMLSGGLLVFARIPLAHRLMRQRYASRCSMPRSCLCGPPRRDRGMGGSLVGRGRKQRQ